MSEPTKITGVQIKLKSVGLIDELLNKAAIDKYEVDEATLELVRAIKRRIIQDFFSDAFIPRANVQAAVDEMQFKADTAALDTPQEIAAVGIRGSIGCIANHTGVTPSEVTP